MLTGYKTYISVICGVICACIYGLGYIDQPTLIALLGIFGFTGLAALRKSISNLLKQLS